MHSIERLKEQHSNSIQEEDSERKVEIEASTEQAVAEGFPFGWNISNFHNEQSIAEQI